MSFIFRKIVEYGVIFLMALVGAIISLGICVGFLLKKCWKSDAGEYLLLAVIITYVSIYELCVWAKEKARLY